MTISAKRQFLSNMLRRLFAFLILGGLIAICSCEPVNRKHLPIASETIECADNEDDGSACGQTNETIDASLQNHEDQPPTDRKVRQKSLDDDMTNQVTGRRKRRGGYGRILIYLVGAMKAALLYGILNGVAALAAKAVLVAKIALAVAIAAILKKNDHEKTSYEIVKHPHYTYAQTHSSSVDYDHRSDFGEENNYDHRKRRRILQ